MIYDNQGLPIAFGQSLRNNRCPAVAIAASAPT